MELNQLANKLKDIVNKAQTDEVEETSAEDGGNLSKACRNKIMSMVQSMEIMDGERENIKAMADELKDEFDLSPKVTKKAAKIIHKGTGMAEMENELAAVMDVLNKVK